MHFSIVTPSFNQLDWLRLCIASVRDQILPPLGLWNEKTIPPGSTLDTRPSTPQIEHIIQDAGTPGIEDLARELGAEFHRNGQIVFHANECSAGVPPAINQPSVLSSQSSDLGRVAALKIFSEPDAGMYDAINKGLARARGEICAYLNCDEQYLEGALQSVALWFSKNPGIDISFGNIVVTDSTGSYLCDRTAVLPNLWHTMTSGNLSVFSAATFFRRSLVERGLVFDPTWRVVGDSIWILSLLKAGLRGKLLRQRVASFAYSPENLSQQQNATEERQRLRAMASDPMRLFAPFTIALSRFRRLLAGGYSIKLHSYRIFTRTTPDHRREFQVSKPTHRWPSRG